MVPPDIEFMGINGSLETRSWAPMESMKLDSGFEKGERGGGGSLYNPISTQIAKRLAANETRYLLQSFLASGYSCPIWVNAIRPLRSIKKTSQIQSTFPNS